MKTIYVDVTVLLNAQHVTGIQRVMIEVLSRFITQQTDKHFKVVLLKELPGRMYAEICCEAFYQRYGQGNRGVLDFENGRTLTIDDMTGNSVFFDMDAVWGCGYQRHQLYPELKKRNIRIIPLIYDTIVLSHPQYCAGETRLTFPPFVSAAIQYADTIIVNAAYTAQEIKRFAEAMGIKRALDCRVIPLGADFGRRDIDIEKVDPIAIEIASHGPYLFTVSTIEPRKNHKILLDAFDKGIQEMGIQLVFAGRFGWEIDQLRKRIVNHPYKNKSFYHLQGKNDETIRYLYQNAYMVLFPSYIEGYGLSTIEAMQQMTPVALSDVPVMHEVGGEYCDYFDPDSADEIIDLIRMYSENPERYNRKKQKLREYQPFTWDMMEEATLDLLLEEPIRKPLGENLKQMVMLTARTEQFLNTIQYVEHLMPFIEEVVLLCPDKTKEEVNKRYQGRLKLKYATDNEILAGDSLPKDHAVRNFLLRCKAMRLPCIDEEFIMSDDDYRPLVPIPKEFFVQDHQFKVYYCHDLGLWTKELKLKNYTSFDWSMERSNAFLTEHGYSNLLYDSHMPQVIRKEWFLDMINEYPEIQNQGLSDWSMYMNYSIAHHPESFFVTPYVTLAWPGRASSWYPVVKPKVYYFENHYSELYEKGWCFEGFSTTFNENSLYENVEKVHRYEAACDGQKRSLQVQREFSNKYRKEYGTWPSYVFSYDSMTGTVKLDVPKYVRMSVNAYQKNPLILDEKTLSSINEHNAKIRIAWGYWAILPEYPEARTIGEIELCGNRNHEMMAIHSLTTCRKCRLHFFYSVNDEPYIEINSVACEIVA